MVSFPFLAVMDFLLEPLLLDILSQLLPSWLIPAQGSILEFIRLHSHGSGFSSYVIRLLSLLVRSLMGPTPSTLGWVPKIRKRGLICLNQQNFIRVKSEIVFYKLM